MKELTAMKIYLVIGETGEYSSHSEWPVVAYDDETAARQHIEFAGNRAKAIFTKRDGAEWEERQALEKSNEWDPGMSMDYTGTEYHLHEIVLNAGAKEPVKP